MNRLFNGLVFVFLLAVGLLNFDCGSQKSPTVPDAQYTGFQAGIRLFYSDANSLTGCNSGCSGTATADVYYYTNGNAQGVTDGVIILTTPTGPTTLSYVPVPPYPNTYSSSFTYQPGFIYAVTISSASGHESGSVTAPGGLSFTSIGSGPVTWTAHWTQPTEYTIVGAADSIGDSYSTPIYSPLTSPFVIPNSAFPNHTTYAISIDCQTYFQSAPVGLVHPFSIEAEDILGASVTE